jgi:hypothetical protein
VFRKEIYLEIHRETGTIEVHEDGHPSEGAAAQVDDSLRKLGDSG